MRDLSGFRGAHQATVLGITTPGLPRGLGVDVDWKSGRVIFRYDAEGANRGEAERLCRDISRAYAVVAVLQAHASLGYQVHVTEEKAEAGGRSVRVSAVRA